MLPALSSFGIALVGVALMSKGADWLTDALVPLARRLGVTSAAVGVLLVAVAVSLPEVLLAIYTAMQGFPGISLGTVLGSIICNIGLMTGLCAMIHPLKIRKKILLRDGIFSIVVPILVFAIAEGGEVTRYEGLALLLLFIPYVVNVFVQEQLQSHERVLGEVREMELQLEFTGIDIGKLTPGFFSFMAGLVVLLAGTSLFGNQLIWLVQDFGVDEVVIGVTLGALGPSLPNIMAAYKAARRGMGEIAVTETLGSNVFTLLVTLGVSALIAPIAIAERWINFDLPVIVAMSFLLFFFLMTKRELSRIEGAVLLGGYLIAVLLQGVVG